MGARAAKVVVRAASWAKRPPIKDPIPAKQKTPLRGVRLASRAPSRKPVDLGQPLWGRTHTRGSNATFALALNYRKDLHKYFTGTLRMAGFGGDVVLATQAEERMDDETKTYLQSVGAICYVRRRPAQR